MSTINNVPFTINRTPTEKNAPVRLKAGTVPVFHSKATTKASRNKKDSERRSGEDRRKFKRNAKINKRLLIKRRQTMSSSKETEQLLSLTRTSGSIIDFEV